MRTRRAIFVLLAVLISLGLVGSAALAGSPDRREVNGTIWVANRGADSIRGFDSATGDVVATIPMRTSSQPGDLAYAKGKLYVAEEFGNSPGPRRSLRPARGQGRPSLKNWREFDRPSVWCSFDKALRSARASASRHRIDVVSGQIPLGGLPPMREPWAAYPHRLIPSRQPQSCQIGSARVRFPTVRGQAPAKIVAAAFALARRRSTGARSPQRRHSVRTRRRR
jgi:hypothetical protein